MLDYKNIPTLTKSIGKILIGNKTPIKVTQYITTRCNLNCVYCGRNNLPGKELTTEEVKYYIKEFKRLGTLFWSFNGGEALIRNDLGELISYVKSLGMKCNLTTNGLLVKNRIEWLKDLDLVTISIDGHKEIQDKIRGNGIFEKNVEALEILAKNKIKTVVFSVITNENIDRLNEVLELAESYGHYWDVQPVITHKGDKGQGAKNFQFDNDKFIKAIDWIIKKKKEGSKIFSALNYLKDMKKFPFCEANKNCWAGRAFCAIGQDGSLYPCAEFIGTEIHKTRVLKGDIKTAFSSIADMKNCKECYFSCYSEYNLILNHKVKSFFKIFNNLVRGKWFWN